MDGGNWAPASVFFLDASHHNTFSLAALETRALALPLWLSGNIVPMGVLALHAVAIL